MYGHNRLQAGFSVALLMAGIAFGAESDPAAEASAKPLPTLLPDRLREERLVYKVVNSMHGNDLGGEAQLTMAKESSEQDGETQAVWRIEFRETGPVPRSNEFVMRAADLALLERYVTMTDGVRHALRFDATGVTGSESGKESEAERFPLPVPVLANWTVALTALPLADGFETLAHTFELVHQTVQWKVQVVGTELVETPAGEFDSYKVALTCIDNDALSATAWITTKAPYRIVRRESAFIPETGMGRQLIELARIEALERP